MGSELLHIFRNTIFMLVFSILDQKQSQSRKYNLLYLDIYGELQKKNSSVGIVFYSEMGDKFCMYGVAWTYNLQLKCILEKQRKNHKVTHLFPEHYAFLSWWWIM